MTELKVNLSVDKGSLSDTTRKIHESMKAGAGGLMGGFQKGFFGGMGGAGAAAPGGLMGTFGKMAGNLGIIAIAVNQGIELGKKMLSVLEKSSPYLKGVLEIFNRSFMLFFKPFGDFLAWMLRPLAMVLLRASVAWIMFTRQFDLGKGFSVLDILGPSGRIAKDLWWLSGMLGNVAKNWPKTPFELKEWISDTVSGWAQDAWSIFKWIAETVSSWFQEKWSIPTWITDITSSWTQTAFDIGNWIWNTVTGWTQSVFDIGKWISDTVKSWFGLGDTPKPKMPEPVKFITLGGTATEARTMQTGPVNSNNDISITINNRGVGSNMETMNFLSKAFRVPTAYNQFGWLR